MTESELHNQEGVISPEHEVDPKSIGIASTTLYKNWYPGPPVPNHFIVDKIRGDLALETFKEAMLKKFQITVIDGGSSETFIQELVAQNIPFTKQEKEKPSMSGGRRQAFKEISGRDGVKVIVWTEPEKISIARDALPKAVLPILQGTADVVIPKRDKVAFATYPDYQTRYEQKANRLWNNILREHKLLPQDAEDLDVWFGPRFFKNDPEIVQTFLDKYEFNKHERKLDEIVNPDLWPNATFLPVISALHKGLRIVNVPVHYTHPAEQTAIEIDNDIFRRKRDIQYKNIIVSTIHFIRTLENDPNKPSKLHAE